MSEWRPIETAPKDGTRILLYEPSDQGDDIYACVFGTYWPHGVGSKDWDYEWGWVVFDGIDTAIACTPTHWMPLPEPPK